MPSNCGSSTLREEPGANANEQGLDQNKAFSLPCQKEQKKELSDLCSNTTTHKISL